MTTNKPLKIYKSSAGSGKTYALVLTYLTLLLKSKDPNKFKTILAVTFTNKAANEMKERIIQGLEKLMDGADTSFINDYIISTGKEPNELAKSASKVLSSILHQYSDFHILTLDKFVHRIIRSFSRELGLTNNFELETDVNDFHQRSIDQLMNNLGVDAELSNFLLQYSQGLLDEDKSHNIEAALLEFCKLLIREEGEQFMGAYEGKELNYFVGIQKKNKQRIRELKQEITGLNDAVFELFITNHQDIAQLKNGNSNYAKVFLALKEGVFDVMFTETQLGYIDNHVWYSTALKKRAPDYTDFIDRIEPDLHKKTQSIIALITELKFHRFVDQQLIAFSLLNAIQGVLTQIKKENNIIFISDFNEIISKVVQNESAPYIYERIGTRYDHFLVDEFQDTSKLQWHNLVPLVYDSLANAHENLIVGDAKQAIYRFRGGEVAQFTQLPKVEAQIEDIRFINSSFDRNHSIAHLDTNYRSSRSIIGFNNWIFAQLIQHTDIHSTKIEEAYTHFEQKEYRDCLGYVCAQTVDKINQKEEHIDQHESIGKYVLDYISECIADGYSYEDITLLVRSRSDGERLASTLIDNGIDVLSSDSITLGSSYSVMQVMHHLQALINPQDAVIIQCLLFHSSNSNVELNNSSTSPPPLIELFDQYRIKNPKDDYYSIGFDFVAFITNQYPDFKPNYFESLSIFDKIDYLTSILQFEKTDPYIDRLYNFAFDYMRTKGSNAIQFIDHFMQRKEYEQVNIGKSAGAVQIMTIHKSKGLQFPVVIIPYNFSSSSGRELGWLSNKKLDQMGLPNISAKIVKDIATIGFEEELKETEDNTLLDDLNLYYVAFTRPEDRLYFINREGRGSKGSNSRDIAKALFDALTAHGTYDTESKKLILGKREPKLCNTTKTTAESNPEETMVDLPSISNWRKKLRLSTSREAQIEDNNTDHEQQVGQWVHEILANVPIPRLHFENLAHFSDQYLEHTAITSSIKDSVRHIIQVIDKSEAFHALFNGTKKIYRERELLTSDGQILRPDIVLAKDNETILIDYKTGAPMKKHTIQINAYGYVLEKMGYENVQKRLVYITEERIDILSLA